jgi:hypothetical protein
MISQEEKSKKVLLAEEKLAQAKAQLNRAKREQRAEIEKAKSHHKYMIGGVVAKYFPACYEFDELEMNRILACAFRCESKCNGESRYPYHSWQYQQKNHGKQCYRASG